MNSVMPTSAASVTPQQQAAPRDSKSGPQAGAGQAGGVSIRQVSGQVAAARSENAPSVQESAQVTRESVEAAAEKIRAFATSMNRDLNIQFDSTSRKAVIRITDPQSNELVRQIPAPEAVELARTIDYLSSLMVSQKA